MTPTKSYDEIVDFIAAGTTHEAGGILPEEQSELDDYPQLEQIMIIAKARARQHTQLGKCCKRIARSDLLLNAQRTGVSMPPSEARSADNLA